MGAVPLLLAIAAVVIWAARSTRTVWTATADAAARERLLARGLVVAGALLALGAVVVVVTGGFIWDVGVPIRMTNVRRTLTYALICAIAAAVVSPRLRRAALDRAPDLTPFLVLAIAFAVVMSLGPIPRAGGRQIVGLGLYDLFFTYVPGYDGLRVPARFGMIAGALLAVLCGYALAAIGRWRRGGAIALAVARPGLPRRGLGGAGADQPDLVLDRPLPAAVADRAPCQRRPARLPLSRCRARGHDHSRAALRRFGLGHALRLLRRAARQAHRQRLQRLLSRRLPGRARRSCRLVGRSRRRVGGGDAAQARRICWCTAMPTRRTRARPSSAGRDSPARFRSPSSPTATSCSPCRRPDTSA